MIFDELNTAFRWYNSLYRQNRFKGQCAALCDFALASTCNDLLPFQIRTNAFGVPTTWNLIYLDGDISIPETAASIIYTPNWAYDGTDFDLQLDLVLPGATPSAKTYYVFGYNLPEDALDAMANTINADATIDVTAIWTGTHFIFRAKHGFGTTANSWHGTWSVFSGSLAILNPNFSFSGGAPESTGTILDISECVENIQKHTADDLSIYLTYSGGALSECLPKQLDCGKWYSTLADDNGHVFYSEVFEVVPIPDATTEFPELDPALFSAWRFYDDINKQTRYKSNCENACGFYLKSDKTSLLPFMFRGDSIGNIQSFKLVGVDDQCEMLIEINLLQKVSYLGYDYVFYNGDAIENLPCGKYYAEICDETQCWYSELIELIDISAVSEFDYLLTDGGNILMTDGGIGITVD